MTGSFSITATNQRGNGTRSREGIEEQIHGASMLSGFFSCYRCSTCRSVSDPNVFRKDKFCTGNRHPEFAE